MNVSNKQIHTFRNIAEVFLRHSVERDNRLYYAVDKVFKSTTISMESYLDSISNAKRDLAMTSTDPKDKGKLLRSPTGGYEYTKEDESKLQATLRKLANDTVAVIEHFVKPEHLKDDLAFEYYDASGNAYMLSDYEVRSAFTDFVIEQKLHIEE